MKETPRNRLTIEKVKDFLPPNSPSINHLLRCGNALNNLNIESNERYFRSFIAVIEELTTSLAKSLCKDSSPRGTAQFVEQTKLGLIRRLQDQLNTQPGTHSEEGQRIRKLFLEQMEIYKISAPGSDIRRYIRAAMCQLPEEVLVDFLGEAADLIDWKRRSRFRERSDFRALLDHGYFDGTAQLSRDALADVNDNFHEEEMHDVVAFVVDHCQMYAHGQRQVPLGDGTM